MAPETKFSPDLIEHSYLNESAEAVITTDAWVKQIGIAEIIILARKYLQEFLIFR
jgi:hypothetical protein